MIEPRAATEAVTSSQTIEGEWVPLRGGELEGRCPTAGPLCPACRANSRGVRPGSSPRALCFQCYRASVERERALRRAGDFDTASVERFQAVLPFEPINRARLERLRMERAEHRTQSHAGTGRFAERQHRAQIAARHALQRIVASAGLATHPTHETSAERERVLAMAIHAAELQLPEAWLPFVVSR